MKRWMLACGALLLAAAVLVPVSAASAAQVPAVPEHVTVERADGTVTASWPSVAGAVSYHVTYSADGGASWKLAALEHPGAEGTTSISIDGADNAATYVVGVRARSADDLWGGWRNSPPAGPWVVPAPDAPVSVALARSDGWLTASWPAAAHAASYHVTYSADGGASWKLAALSLRAVEGVNSITIEADNAATYVVGVRARNSSGASGWVNSAPAGPFVPPLPLSPPPSPPVGLRANPGDGQVRLSWNGPGDASVLGYEYRMRWAGVAWSAWTAMAGSGPSTVSHVVDGLDNGVEYRFKLRALGDGGASPAVPASSPWYVAAVPTDEVTVAVANPLPGTATMTVTGHNGQWWHQASGQVPPGGDGAAGAAAGGGDETLTGCVGPVNGAQAQVTGLDQKADWAFGAYSDGACTAGIASASSQGSVARPGGVFEQFFGRTDGALRVLWTASATSGAVYDVVYSSDGGATWERAATGISGAACPTDQLGGRKAGLCYTITGPVGGSGNRMDNTATYIVGVRATKGGVSSWWRNSSALDPLPEPRVTAYVTACPGSTDYVLYMRWAKLPEAGITEEVRYKIGNGAWVNLPAEDENTPDHRKIRGSGRPGSRWLNWMDQLDAASPSYSVTAQVRRTGTLGSDTVRSTWGAETFNAGTSSDVKRWYTRCPAAPTGLTGSAPSATTVNVTWNAVTGPHHYDIRYRAGSTGDWTDAATGHQTTSYAITGLTVGTAYQTEVRARSWDGGEAGDWTRLDFVAGIDYDTDNDRLIEISTLAQLNAIRWDTDGNGRVTGSNQNSYRLAFPNATAYTGTTAMGCPSTGCTGYELAADLDFDEDGDGVRDDTYNTGSGWDPIGSYNTTLKGNGHRIDGLYINRAYSSSGNVYVGMFGDTSAGARISGFALGDVNVYGAGTAGGGSAATPWVGALAGRLVAGATVSGISVSGTVRAWRNFVSSGFAIAGGLIGQNRGTVSGVSSIAYVEARMGGTTFSGGDAGGIVGHNGGTITESWFSGHAKGIGRDDARVGGIAAVQTGSTSAIKASYSTGTVEADTAVNGPDHHAGGIVGNLVNGTVEAVYAAGSVVSSSAKGGITATSSGGTVTDSYYDSTVMGTLSGGRGTAKITSELQTPTGYSGIYADWNLNLDGVTGDDDPWDFGTSSDYPVLKSAPAGLAVTNIAHTTATLALGNQTSAWWYKGDQSGATCTSVAAGTTTAGLATLTAGTAYTYKAYSDSGCTAEIGSVTFTTTSVDYDADNDRLIEIKTLGQLNAMRWDGDGNGQVASTDQASYSTAFPNGARTGTTAMGCPNTCQGYELAADLDFDTNSSGSADSGDTYWNSGSGWDPIAGFNTALKGNGHAIDNLHINRSYSNTLSSSVVRVGLFGSLGATATISGLALNDVDVYGATTDNNQTAAATRVGALAGDTASGTQVSDVSVSGRVRTWRGFVVNSYADAGGLIAINKGTVSGVSSTAYVEAKMGTGSTGGDAGGIVSHNSGTITESWFSGHVKGDGGANARVGGIAAVQTGGAIKASYSTGTVEANTTLSSGTNRLAGGVVGNLVAGTVEAVYAAGSVSGNTSKGGVTASSSGGTVTNSYYDSTAMGALSGGRGTAKTTSELQTPTAYGTGNSIYANWNLNLDGVTGGDDPWDFGTASNYPVLKQAATGLDVRDIAGTSATLAIVNHNGAWWYKGSQGGATCTAVTAGTTTAALTLTGSTTYTYTAYSNSSCTTSFGRGVTFTTDHSLGVSAVTSTTATLTRSWSAGNWYVKQTAPSVGSCSSAISGTTHGLSPLAAGTTYTYKAYSNVSCTTELASATFTTPALTAGGTGGDQVTLTFSGHTGSWYVKQTAPTSGSCSTAISTSTRLITTLSRSTTYTYKAYSDAGCATELASVTFTTTGGLTASSVTATGAMLTLDLYTHPVTWYWKQTSPSSGTCWTKMSGTTVSLNGTLTAGRTYTYKAYSNSSCSASAEIASVTFSTPSS